MSGVRIRGRFSVAALVLLAGGSVVAQQQAPPPVTVQDCTKLKGKAKKDCAAAAPAPGQSKSGETGPAQDDKFAFPDDASKNGGELQQRTVTGSPATKPATGDMPTSGVPDPPAESMQPLRPDGTPAPAGSSSSSSSSSGGDAAADDDAAPTTAGADTPVKSSDLRNLGQPKGDVTEARTKLEATRVQDDIKVGHFYFKDGDYTGAAARYRDALERDPENPDAHFGLAEVLLKQNKRADAALELQKYLQLAPDDDHTKDARKMLAKLR